MSWVAVRATGSDEEVVTHDLKSTGVPSRRLKDGDALTPNLDRRLTQMLNFGLVCPAIGIDGGLEVLAWT